MIRRLDLLQPPERAKSELAALRLPTKSLALAAYLAVANRPIAREEVALLLWGETKDGRHDLRNALYVIRKVWGSGVLHDDQFGLSLDVECDVREFLGAVARGAPHEAIALYTGQFLTWVTVNTDAWSDWVTQCRDELQQKAAEVCKQVCDASIENQDYDKAIKTARRWISIDPLDERAHAILIRLLLETGETVMAHRRFLKYADVMRRHLGIAPDAATMRLIRESQGKRAFHLVKSRLDKVADEFDSALLGRRKLDRGFVGRAVTVMRTASVALESTDTGNDEHRPTRAPAHVA